MREIIKTILIRTSPPIIVILAVVFLYFFTDIFKKEEPVVIPVPINTVSQYPDYEAYKVMEKKLILAENKESYSPKDKAIIGKISKTIIVHGEFSRAYLYVDASVDQGKPLTQWDSVFTNLQYTGGHLYRPDSLNIPSGSSTQLLYGLNQIPFITFPYSDNKTPIVKDWFSQLEDGSRLSFDLFLSSLRAGGVLNLVEIRYECEVNTECGLEVK